MVVRRWGRVAFVLSVSTVLACGARSDLEVNPIPVEAGHTPRDTETGPSDTGIEPRDAAGTCVLYTLPPDGTYGGGDTWVWNNASWTREAETLPTPMECLPDACGYVGTLVNVGGQLVFVGTVDSSGAIDVETWAWSGSGWVQRVTVGPPPARWSPAVAALDDTIVLFGGWDGSATLVAETWVLRGSTWTEQQPAARPPARALASAASVDGKLLLFGGADNSGPLGDAWSWDGMTWAPVSTLGGPSPRSGAAAVSVAGHVLLFGGCLGGGYQGCGDIGASTAEMWQWTPTDSWAVLHPATSPPARDLAVTASFGPGAMLFGGYTGSGDAIALTDTWLWDGTTWAVQSGARLPPLGSAALGCE